MPYLIDSDWIIDHLADSPEAQELLSDLAEEGIAISIVTYMETYEGALRSSNPQEAVERLQALLLVLPVLPFNPEVAQRCAALRIQLRDQNKRVNNRALDLLIAATALHYGLTLVTRNVRDYRDVPGLSIHTRT